MAPPETLRDFTFISSRNEGLRTVLHALYIRLNHVFTRQHRSTSRVKHLAPSTNL